MSVRPLSLGHGFIFVRTVVSINNDIFYCPLKIFLYLVSKKSYLKRFDWPKTKWGWSGWVGKIDFVLAKVKVFYAKWQLILHFPLCQIDVLKCSKKQTLHWGHCCLENWLRQGLQIRLTAGPSSPKQTLSLWEVIGIFSMCRKIPWKCTIVLKGFLLFYPIKTQHFAIKFNIFFFSNVHFSKHYVHFSLSIWKRS